MKGHSLEFVMVNFCKNRKCYAVFLFPPENIQCSL